jgi:hypothetical protein
MKCLRPKWRNWQTRRTQNPVGETPCGFESHLRHWARDVPRGVAELGVYAAKCGWMTGRAEPRGGGEPRRTVGSGLQ